MTYEELQILNSNLNIIEMDLSEVRDLKGLYYDKNIAIEKTMSSKEKACVLAEELGHHYTTYGNIISQDSVSDRKQELRARLWAYDKQIGLLGLVKSYEHGCRTKLEIAEFLDVTEDFLTCALERYRQKYGIYATIDNYIIYFEPCLGVMNMN